VSSHAVPARRDRTRPSSLRSDHSGVSNDEPALAGRRYGRDSIEFARVVNLSDGVFAIALTLLVLNLVVPDIDADQLGSMWRDLVPNLIAFALAFGLIANIWWLHHKVVAALGSLEPGMIAINTIGLAGVVLVPFPTSLVGAHPDEQAAVVPFVALFLAVSTVWLLFVLRADRVAAWSRPLPAATFRWLLLEWCASLAPLVLALIVALVNPVAALIILPVTSGVVAAVSGRFGPDRSAWF
jgi:uncharacterized membrane protein